MAGSLTTYQSAMAQANPSLQNKDKTERHVWSWLSDDADGSIAAKASAKTINGFIVAAIWNPGSAAPTDNYDTVLTDADGVDVLGGVGANRDTANSEQGLPLVGGAYAPRRVDSVLTFSGSNAGNEKTGEFIIIVSKDCPQ
jgi:hypothetical protein